MMYIDASEKAMGRLSSITAKSLLNGNHIIILNAEKALITGKKKMIVNKYLTLMGLKSLVNPRRFGPFKFRSPDAILRMAIRGMIPRDKTKGKEAMRRLKIYVGIPKKYDNVEMHVFPHLENLKSGNISITINELSHTLGWRSIEEKIDA